MLNSELLSPRVDTVTYIFSCLYIINSIYDPKSTGLDFFSQMRPWDSKGDIIKNEYKYIFLGLSSYLVNLRYSLHCNIYIFLMTEIMK